MFSGNLAQETSSSLPLAIFISSSIMCLYYHYTDRDGLRGILRSGKINKSSSGRHGSGVYLTTMEPKYGRKKVAGNNWDGAGPIAELQGKTDYCISVFLPEEEVKCFQNKDGTEIYLFNDHVYLNRTTWKLHSKKGDHDELRP